VTLAARHARRYRTPQLRELCEHCDGPRPTRNDYLRGYVCRDCDSALDAMDAEAAKEDDR
jgi:hypothetical protein